MARSLPAIPKVRIPSLRPPKDDASYEDVFEEMTLAEHLDELRSRIVKTCMAIGAAFIVGVFLAGPALDFIKDTTLVQDTLQQDLASGQEPRFDVNEATEPITAYFKVALYIAIGIALPVIFYQMFAFVAPGLTRKEKRLVYGSLPFVVILFLAGTSFAFFLAIPRAFAFLSSFKTDTFEYTPTFGSIASFILQVSLGMGIAFELPIIMYLLSRLGIVSAKRMSASRRYAAVLVLIAAALITPTPDPFNMLFVAGPIYLLYEFGIILARIAGIRTRSAATAG